MSHEIHADYSQVVMFPPCLEDWVGADHPARFIREFVDALDLPGLGFVEHESDEGRPPYASELMLKVWLYGYRARIRSPRDLERACREHLWLLWLTGQHAPDHNTWWRFWHANRKALREVFRTAVKVAAEQGLVGMICHAVDGTKIRAVASRRTMEHQGDWEKLLARVEASIAEMEGAVEAAEEEAAGEYRLPARLQEATELRAAIQASLAKMREAEREPLHPQETEARLMACEGRMDPAYNAQAVADAQTGVVVAQAVVNAESDNAQLVPMLEQVQANLGAVAQETVADGGYASAEQLGEAAARGHEVRVAPGVESGGGGRKPGEFDSRKFTYDPAADEVICPQGQRLNFEGMKKEAGQTAVRSYRCTHSAQCPMRTRCSQRADGRRIEVSPHHAALQRQRAKRQDPAKQALLRQRQVIIEPVFARIKQILGFRRWTVRGLENVRTQWALLCTALNLQKLYQHWAAPLAKG